ncbi:MAG: peptide chain release factor N(5)-glutamine methyltransferase [Chloroflexota bacterium]|nr:peptide chain release factor N(5)-glutamine methyltransferase [Chloroflexota bacterium]
MALSEATEQLCAASVADARLEAELLLAHACGIDRAHLIARLKDPLKPTTIAAFRRLLARRLAHEPLAYITGCREFYGIDILCGPAALVPRPESELLVDLALAEVRARGAALRIADVGTGSGAIACAVAAHAAAARVCAVDVSSAALALACRNVEALGLGGRVDVGQGDLLGGLGALDVVVANLPYVSESEWCGLQPEVRDFEPREALVAGIAGTELNARLLAQAPAHLARGGLLALEMGPTHARALSAVARTHFPGASVSVIKDLGGHDRVLLVRQGEEARWRTTT